ncbi:MAG: hemolysin family protein [Candidatus Cloacimonadaceae bacterium]
MSEGSSLYWIFLFLAVSAFFSASETALFSLNKLQQKKLEGSDKKSDKRILKMLTKPRFLLITILLGNTLVNISISSFATVYALWLKEHLGLTLSNSALITIQIIVTTIVILILGEIVPKLIAWAKAYSLARIVSLPLLIMGYVLWPLLKLLELFSKILSRQKALSLEDEITTEEFHTLIQSQNTIHNLEEHEKKILAGLFRLPKAEIREIIVPRVRIMAIEVSQTLDELKHLIVESGYSRIPVFRSTIDDIVGVAYAKDILLHPEIVTIDKLMRPAWFVTENMKIQTLLNQFKSKKTQIAVVVDEYGGTSGIITLEDIMEELVGEIQDEYDEDEAPSFVRENESSVIVDGMFSIRELNQEMHLDIEPDNYDNVADFLLEYFNHVPKVNENLLYADRIKFTILESDTKCINRIRIEQIPEPEDISQ